MKKKELIIDRSIPGQVRIGLELIRSTLMSGKGSIRIEIMEHRPRRSDRQNRMYWPCIVEPFSDFLCEQGQFTTPEEAHELIKAKFLKKTKVNPVTGEQFEFAGSTTELNTREFSEFVEHSAFWLHDMFGIKTPSPDDIRKAHHSNCEANNDK